MDWPGLLATKDGKSGANGGRGIWGVFPGLQLVLWKGTQYQFQVLVTVL